MKDKLTVKASLEALILKYKILPENIIQFNFYTFPIAIKTINPLAPKATNLYATLCTINSGESHFDSFSDSVYRAMRYACRSRLTYAHKISSSTDNNCSDCTYIFTVLDGSGKKAETVCYMLRIVLHTWGEPEKKLPDSDKEAKRRTEIEQHVPKCVGDGECVVVDSDNTIDPATGEEYKFQYREGSHIRLIKLTPEPTVKRLTLEEAQELLQNKLRNEWNLNLTIDWK